MSNFLQFLDQLQVNSSLLHTLVLYLVSSLFTLFLIKRHFTPTSNKKNLPPSPPKLPVIGNFHQLGNYPHRSLQSLARKHGPVILLHFGPIPVLVITSPDAAREIMKTHDLIFSNRTKTIIPSKLLYDSKDMVYAPYGEYWRQVKSIAVLNLLSNKRVQSYKCAREEETAIMVEKINNTRGLINLSDMFKSLTNNIVSRVALGRKLGGEDRRRFKELLVEFEELLGIFCVGDYVPWLWWIDRVSGLLGRVEKNAKEIDEFLEGVISDHMENKKRDSEGEREGEEKNFVDILLEIQRENTLGFPISRDTIKALIMDMVAPGTDTTYAILEWATAELIKHPQILIKLQNEVRQIGKGKSNINEEDLENMKYLKSVIKEALRLHAPVPLLVPRESTEDAKIMGYDVKAGTQVIVNAWAIGRDPSVWEDPGEFRPERFLNSSIDFKGFHFELIPFGAGRRGCPGALFAIAVNELALANLLYKFDIALPDGERAEDLDMTETIGITIHKKSPIVVVATPYFS
ncbi:hypothetical protein LguiB_031874 [Lonicera macranthoides]